MRLERLDKMAQAIERRRAAARPRIPEAPDIVGIDYDRPMEGEGAADDDYVDPNARRSVEPHFQREEDLERTVEEANVLAERLPQRGLLFELDYSGENHVIIVMDPDTREVHQRMSPQEFLTFMTRIREVVGLFFDRVV
ncbi:MAG: flagellar protein FlaG [Candidatus Poribacteria bacterium]|nr:flagellar protein FlaG [Candidatus Poribacteria bacterium]